MHLLQGHSGSIVCVKYENDRNLTGHFSPEGSDDLYRNKVHQNQV